MGGVLKSESYSDEKEESFLNVPFLVEKYIKHAIVSIYVNHFEYRNEKE